MRATLPYPPSVNHYWIHTRRGVVLGKKGRAYKLGALMRARTQGMRPIDGPVCVSVAVFRPRKIGDIDNVLKCLLDSIKGAAYHDDSQIIELHARRYDDAANPRVEVTVEATS